MVPHFKRLSDFILAKRWYRRAVFMPGPERHDRRIGHRFALPRCVLLHPGHEIRSDHGPAVPRIQQHLPHVDRIDRDPPPGPGPLDADPAHGTQPRQLAFDGALVDGPQPRHLGPAHRQFIALPVVARRQQRDEAQHQHLRMPGRGQAVHAKRGHDIILARRRMAAHCPGCLHRRPFSLPRSGVDPGEIPRPVRLLWSSQRFSEGCRD